MSKVIKVVFVNGDSIISSIIKTVEELGEIIHGSNNIDFVPSHSGIIIDNNFREAILNGFVGETLRRYNPKQLRIYDLVVTDEEYIKAGDKEFNNLLGNAYSVKACLTGGIYTLFNKPTKDKKISADDCSGNVIDILRAYGFNILQGIPAQDITPNILLTEIDKIGKLEDINEVLNNYVND